jgi:hypothetical protein
VRMIPKPPKNDHPGGSRPCPKWHPKWSLASEVSISKPVFETLTGEHDNLPWKIHSVDSLETYYAITGELIGEGGFGEVFLCGLRDVSASPSGKRRWTGKQVLALKIVDKSEGTWLAVSPEQEAEKLQQMVDHELPHVIKYFDFFADECYRYEVIEYCCGPTLWNVLVGSCVPP